jgi:hypothetical protein
MYLFGYEVDNLFIFLHDFTLIIISLAALQNLICHKSDRPVFAGAF